jgi:hypothetical protein
MWIYFERDANGRPIAICADTGQKHDCPKSPWNLKKQRKIRARAIAKTEIEKIERFEREETS